PFTDTGGRKAKVPSGISKEEIRQGGRQYVEITGHPGTGTGTCDIGEQFAKGLDGLYGYRSETIPVSFYRPVTDPRTASTGNRLCVPGTVE
ncbi:hypothetical protein, partial [Waltera sp.]|uniref:hypothetical protein n=1 Tax=Waltera sp. TaxID=2815806 RepID=UPI003AB9AD94